MLPRGGRSWLVPVLRLWAPLWHSCSSTSQDTVANYIRSFFLHQYSDGDQHLHGSVLWEAFRIWTMDHADSEGLLDPDINRSGSMIQIHTVLWSYSTDWSIVKSHIMYLYRFYLYYYKCTYWHFSGLLTTVVLIWARAGLLCGLWRQHLDVWKN